MVTRQMMKSHSQASGPPVALPGRWPFIGPGVVALWAGSSATILVGVFYGYWQRPLPDRTLARRYRAPLRRRAASGSVVVSMPVSSSRLSRSAIVATLRVAGCVFAEDEARLLISAAPTPADLAAMVERRAAGLPLEHVVGWAEFCGLRVAVEPGVFVPRRRTEFLVQQAAAVAPPRAVVVDLCCGSGAVGAALGAALDRIELHAADIDPAAVRCARRNVAAANGHVYEGDLYEPLPATLRGRVDVLVANAPYVPAAAIGLLPPEARLHEPRVALDGGADGLDMQRRVIVAAPQWLAPGGHLLVETSELQAPQTAEALARNGLIPQVDRSDDLDATVVTGMIHLPGGVGARHEAQTG
jgi:release factor glutamine methyltransferase